MQGCSAEDDLTAISTNVVALIIRTGLWGPSYYSFNKEPPK